MKRELIVYPLFFVLLLAVSDEFLQSFVDRRSNVRDIVLDFSGGNFRDDSHSNLSTNEVNNEKLAYVS